jgi:hypothetical protein
MEMGDMARLAAGLAGVRCTTRQGLAEWRYHGRLVARQLDDVHLVIRAEFGYRDFAAPAVSGYVQRPGPVPQAHDGRC